MERAPILAANRTPSGDTARNRPSRRLGEAAYSRPSYDRAKGEFLSRIQDASRSGDCGSLAIGRSSSQLTPEPSSPPPPILSTGNTPYLTGTARRILAPMDKNPPSQCVALAHCNGIDSATRSMIPARTSELALIAGHFSPHVTQDDYEQAQRELSAGAPAKPRESTPGSPPSNGRAKPRAESSMSGPIGFSERRVVSRAGIDL